MTIRVWTLSIFTLITSFTFPSSVFAQVVINEFAPNATEEWVEFYNASESADYLKNYWIDDTPEGGKPKRQLTALNIDNPKFPYFSLGDGFLNNNGDKLVLYDENNVVVDQYEFSSVPSDGLSIGRYPDKTGSFAFLQSATKGNSNSAPKVDPTPSPSPSPTPTLTPSPSPSPSPTQKPSITPKPTLRPTTVPTSSNQVLGQQSSQLPIDLEGNPTPEPLVEGVTQANDTPLLAIILTLAGVIFVTFSLYSFLKVRQKKGIMDEREDID